MQYVDERDYMYVYPNEVFLQFCYDVICPPLQYNPPFDVLNAAQSGAMVPNLVSHEFKYLMEQLNSVSL